MASLSGTVPLYTNITFSEPSVTTNPLPTHTSHVVLPLVGGIHFMDFTEPDDRIHMLSWDDGLSESIILDDGYEVDIVGFQTSTLFSLISDWVPFEWTPIAPLVTTH